MLCSPHAPQPLTPFLPSFERLLLHAVCQYMDLISASECPLPLPAPPALLREQRPSPSPRGVPCRFIAELWPWSLVVI